MWVAGFKLLNPKVTHKGVTPFIPFNANIEDEYNPNKFITDNKGTPISTKGALITRCNFKDNYPYLSVICQTSDPITGRRLMTKNEALDIEKLHGKQEGIIFYCKLHGYNKIINLHSQRQYCHEVESIFTIE